MNKFLTLAAAATLVLGFAATAHAGGGYYNNDNPSIDVSFGGYHGLSVEVDNYDYVNVNVGNVDASTTLWVGHDLNGDVTIDTTAVGANFNSRRLAGNINALNVNVGDVYASTGVTVKGNVGHYSVTEINTTAIGANMTLGHNNDD